MENYDYLNLLKAIRMCAENPKFGVGIFLDTARTREEVFRDALHAIIDDSEENELLEYSNGLGAKSTIMFKNGSFIYFLSPLETVGHVRGHKFHHTLASSNYYGQKESGAIKDLIRSTEIPYRRDQP